MNSAKKILVVYGTRPELIKLIPLIRELQGRKNCDLSVCSTGQHRELVKGIESQFDLREVIALNIMKKNQTLAQMIARLSAKFPKVLDSVDPDWTVVQGDTTSAYMVALLSRLRKTKVAHVEAGLRSFDVENPFPEELNRKMISQVSHLHFAPTALAARNLKKEGIERKTIFITGNTVVDAMRISSRTKTTPTARKVLARVLSKEFALVTMHRRESFGRPLASVCDAIAGFARRTPMHFVWPVHKNPNVEPVVRKAMAGLGNVHLVDPLDYFDFFHVLSNCRFVVSDSGGVQEESPYLGKPLLILREKTERPECVQCGGAMLVGTDKNKILKYMELLSTDSVLYRRMAKVRKPFGDGRAAKRIADIMMKRDD